MKKRGFIAILLGVLAILYILQDGKRARQRAWEHGRPIDLTAYEVDSAASSLSGRFRIILQSGFVLMVGGLCLCIVDYQRWKKRKES